MYYFIVLAYQFTISFKDIITEQMGKGVKEKLKIATELKIKLSVGLDWGNLRHAIETG